MCDPSLRDISLDREGFAVLHNASAVQDFWDEDEVRRVYYPEVQRVIAEATGASKVFIFDHTLRRRVRGAADRVAWHAAPARDRRACRSYGDVRTAAGARLLRR